MNKSARIFPLFILVAALLIAGIAATSATLAQPDGPSVQATANGGEIVISWDKVSGAQYYTVGWVNWTKGKPVSDAGGDWLSLFHYTTVLGSETSYTVKGLEEGQDHYAIIRATDAGGAADRFGGGYSQWSAWSSSSAQPAGQHGEGFCPITGLPLPPTGYASVGSSTTHSLGRVFTLNSVTQQSSIRLGDSTFPPFAGRQYVKVCGTVQASAEFSEFFFSGKEYNVDTDAGLGFAFYDDNVTDWIDIGEITPGQTRSACEVWDIANTASTVIIAINNWRANPALYKVDLP